MRGNAGEYGGARSAFPTAAERAYRLLRLLPRPFLSGACALIYQIAWTRDFRLVFGASTLASAAAIAIFIGGLGLGAWQLGSRVDRAANPLRTYAALELGVALSAAVTRLLLPLAMRVYVALGGSVVLGSTGATLVRLVLATLVLAVPTLLMGGTLPALARAALPVTGDPARRGVALLYGVNTLGAVAGCMLATFVLIERLGTSRTLLCAAALNVLVALAALRLSRAQVEPLPAALLATDDDVAPMSAPSWFVAAAAALVGFAFFLMEMVFYRMLVPLLGGTVYTFGLVLAVALLGTGVGGAVYALVARRASTLLGLAATCLLEALGLGTAYALGDRLAILAIRLRPEGMVPLPRYLPGWFAVTAIVLLLK